MMMTLLLFTSEQKKGIKGRESKVCMCLYGCVWEARGNFIKFGNVQERFQFVPLVTWNMMKNKENGLSSFLPVDLLTIELMWWLSMFITTNLNILLVIRLPSVWLDAVKQVSISLYMCPTYFSLHNDPPDFSLHCFFLPSASFSLSFVFLLSLFLCLLLFLLSPCPQLFNFSRLSYPIALFVAHKASLSCQALYSLSVICLHIFTVLGFPAYETLNFAAAKDRCIRKKCVLYTNIQSQHYEADFAQVLSALRSQF